MDCINYIIQITAIIDNIDVKFKVDAIFKDLGIVGCFAK
jgi:hypothetical protein